MFIFDNCLWLLINMYLGILHRVHSVPYFNHLYLLKIYVLFIDAHVGGFGSYLFGMSETIAKQSKADYA